MMGLFSRFGEMGKKAVKEGVIGGINLLIKKPLRGAKFRDAGIDVHYQRAGERRLPTYKRFKPMIDHMGSQNNVLKQIESRFLGMFNEVIPLVEEVYKFCGSYQSAELAGYEQGLCSRGSANLDGMKDELYQKILTRSGKGKDEVKEDSEIPKDMELTTNILGKEYIFYLPPRVNIYFEDDTQNLFFEEGRIEKGIRYFGYSTNQKWTEIYNAFIENVCNDVIKRVNEDERIINNTSANKDERIAYIRDQIKAVFKGKLNLFFSEKNYNGTRFSIGGYEHSFYKFLGYIKEKMVEAGTSIKARINKEYNEPEMTIKYKHTYKIARPIVKDFNGKIVTKDRKELRLTGFGIDPPLDERGMPWEVDDDNKIMVGPHKGKKVPEEFIRDIPWHKMAAYIFGQYDAFRDDLRDGRYHPKSMTATDYLMANHESVGWEWEQKEETNLQSEDRKYKMKLHSGEEIDGVRKPSDINPAFDLDFFKPIENGVIGAPKDAEKDKPIHIGRPYYYDDSDGIAVEEQDAKIATTRGTAMYLIDKIVSESQILAEAHKELKEEIGDSAGFDYGPRPLGDQLCTDPFKVNIGSANASLKPHKKED